MIQTMRRRTQKPVVKGKQRQPQKASKSPEFVETESHDPDDNGEEEEPVVKRIHKLTKKAPKSPRLTNADLEDSDDDDEEKEPVLKKVSKFLGLAETSPESSGDPDTEDNPRAMGFPIDKSLEVGKNEEESVHKKRDLQRQKNIICCKI